MRIAVFRDYGAVCLCQVCGDVERIADMDLDHHLAIIDGGEHQTANLRPLCHSYHAKKSAMEHKNNCKAKRLALARGAIRAPGKIKSRGFDKTLRKRMNGKVEKRT
jgi:5-methylcytosine-specific restriction endonuclease McrA